MGLRARVSILGAVSSLLPAIGCSYTYSDAAGPPLHPFDAGADNVVNLDGVANIDDATTPGQRYCGTLHCNPDDPFLCVASESDGGLSKLACRVVEGPEAVCAPAGLQGEGTIGCLSDNDCAPGLACVAGLGLGGGRCLKYCCSALSSSDSCDPSQYCTPLPLTARPKSKVPVCAKLDNCRLLADFEKCATGSTCTVVRNDGATTCIPTGVLGECADCSMEACAAGSACLGPANNRRCRKLCHAGKDLECHSKRCESLPTIPIDFGVCAPGIDAGC
ncbi:MAG: hypothetical protein NVS3B20_21880 [Polyangiales bacterium]